MSISDEWFREWFDSSYYHTLYFDRNEQEATSFLNRLASYLNPPEGARVVDIACGKGRHARILAEKGFDVTGIDLAVNSIAYARKFENEHLHFFLHDMRQSFRINYFDYAFNFFTSFGYFRTEREHYNVIRTISHALKNQGMLVLDYLNVHYAEDHLVHRSEKKIGGVTYYLTKWFDETHFYKKIIIEDEQLEEPLEYMEKVAKFTLGDFNDMFSFHGLQIQEIFGDYELGPYDINRSPRLLLVARKTGK
jgi:2-polyprenyl-3-methyl-5-hydroxy-6-metoxy-1,4-benzoquinol methylase